MEYTDKMFNRLRRIEGQIRGVIRLMEKERDCKEVVTQLSAVRSAVDRAIAAIVVENLEECIRKDIEEDKSTHETVKQAIDLLLKSR
ncbi:metal-sensitive transcriptional regulator [Alicyclobacillus suci]|uniref:metal-sensitive transcriptional regulator n=1 Tax=Alicyclobacillus suci TaxID=2816080 RepID=UPI001A8DE603|nr:metal-sensitive transcriptional regulator [Alicyclobacillus suci]